MKNTFYGIQRLIKYTSTVPSVPGQVNHGVDCGLLVHVVTPLVPTLKESSVKQLFTQVLKCTKNTSVQKLPDRIHNLLFGDGIDRVVLCFDDNQIVIIGLCNSNTVLTNVYTLFSVSLGRHYQLKNTDFTEKKIRLFTHYVRFCTFSAQCCGSRFNAGPWIRILIRIRIQEGKNSSQKY